MMVLTHVITVSLAARLAAGYLVTPWETPYPGAASDCSEWVEGETGLTAAEFESWERENPSVIKAETNPPLSH